MKIEVCFSPALFKYYEVHPATTVVLVDIFRASTSICSAFSAGAKSIIPVASVEEARVYKSKGFLVGAERNVARCDFADFGNSPLEYMNDKVQNKEIVLTTTNGTQALKIAEGMETIVVGAFANLNVVADFCIRKAEDIMVLCAGWNNQVNLEDLLFGGALTEILFQQMQVTDSSKIALTLWKQAKTDLKLFLKDSEHVQRLLNHQLEKDIVECLTLNTTSVLPIFNRFTNQLELNK